MVLANATLLELACKKHILLDGGMGTMLIAAGLKQGQIPELLNLEQPNVVQAVHEQYLAAGSEAILTNTFGASSIKLNDSKLAEKTGEMNVAGARIALAAAGDRFVIGDVGPVGKLLQPYGDLTELELRKSLEQQIGSLLEGGVNALILETQMDVREAINGAEIARALTSLPVIVSFTFNRTKRGYFTLMGNSVQSAISGALEAGADIVGTNCSLDSSEMKDLISEISTCTHAPVYAKANAGKAELIDGAVSYGQSVDDFTANMPSFLENGARLIGGCCGTDPNYISALRDCLGAAALAAR
jgi:5-methyltetrahydrofolate--homocysteine methyltransferase